MKVLRIILKKLQEVLALLKMLDTEFRKIKRQKFIVLGIIALILFRCSLPFMTANPECMKIVESVQNWVLPVFTCILVLIGIGIICMALSTYFYQKQEESL